MTAITPSRFKQKKAVIDELSNASGRNAMMLSALRGMLIRIRKFEGLPLRRRVSSSFSCIRREKELSTLCLFASGSVLFGKNTREGTTF